MSLSYAFVPDHSPRTGPSPEAPYKRLSVQFFFNETKSRNQVSRFWLWDSHCENPVVGVEKRLPYLPQDQRSRH